MLKSFFSWWHHVSNPHCIECRDEKEDASICQSCEILKVQLEVANREKQQLLQALLPKPMQTPTASENNLEPIRGRHVPFNVRRQILESESRREAVLMAAKQKEMTEVPKDISVKTAISVPAQNQSIEDLEKELGVESA